MKIWLTSTLWLVLLFVCVSYQEDTTPEAETNPEGDDESPSEEETSDTEPEDETEPEATTETPKDSAETCKVVSMATVLSVILLNRVIV